MRTQGQALTLDAFSQQTPPEHLLCAGALPPRNPRICDRAPLRRLQLSRMWTVTEGSLAQGSVPLSVFERRCWCFCLNQLSKPLPLGSQGSGGPAVEENSAPRCCGMAPETSFQTHSKRHSGGVRPTQAEGRDGSLRGPRAGHAASCPLLSALLGP